MFKYQGEKFLTDNDLQVVNLGRYPNVKIEDPKLREYYREVFGRPFLGGDEIISHRQPLVAKGMSFDALEQDFLKYVGDDNVKENIFSKTFTGIGAGHSMGGLAGIVLGVHGTKMIDLGFTGLCMSRSIVTSGRRRDVKQSDIVIPEALTQRPKLMREYLKISKAAFNESAKFKERFGRLEGIETFNKALPYNNPADLFIVLPLDTMATLYFEAQADLANPNGPFLPKEHHTLVSMFPQLAEENGLDVMYKQRIQVPRNGYFHYTVFKDPAVPNYPGDLAKARGIPITPQVIKSHFDLTPGFRKGLEAITAHRERTSKLTNPKKLVEASMQDVFLLRALTENYSEAVDIQMLEANSVRIESEKKRHSTLRQEVEPIYIAAQRAIKNIRGMWGTIEAIYNGESNASLDLERLSDSIVIDSRLKHNPELLKSYAYHSARQLLFYDKLIKEGVSSRDAAFTIPRNIKVLNLVNFDLINMVGLYGPLRSCPQCEPEMYKNTWSEFNLMKKAFPELKSLFKPKCNVGFCTERDYCTHINSIRKGYTPELHQAINNYRKSISE